MKDTQPTAQAVNGQTAKVGDTYRRERYEVQSLSASGWRGGAGFKTIDEARNSTQLDGQTRAALRDFIDLGKPAKVRIVRVVSVCTVVE